jgi:hypothetical protein
MLDPYYRTFRGFATLIEKEWVSFGHQFATRHGLFTDSTENQRAPIFLQFVDCVWQLMRQLSNEFEFNDTLLVYLLDQSMTMLFSTFAFDSESARKSSLSSNPANSIWSLLPTLQRTKWIFSAVFLLPDKQNACSNPETCSNPSYNPSTNQQWLSPSLLPFDIVIWRSYYLRWISSSDLTLPLLGTGGVRGWYCGQIGMHEGIQQKMTWSRQFTGISQPLLFPFGSPALPSPVPTAPPKPIEPEFRVQTLVPIAESFLNPDAPHFRTAPATTSSSYRVGDPQLSYMSRTKSENASVSSPKDSIVRDLARSEPTPARPPGRQFELHSATVEKFVIPFGHTPVQARLPAPKLPPAPPKYAPPHAPSKELQRNASTPNFGAGHHRAKPK